MPPMPEIAMPTPEAPEPESLLPEPPTPPEITVTTSSADGNIDVSVRIESPDAHEEAAGGAISASPGGDITSTRIDPATSSTDDSADPDATAATNANVSVRVFSPGDDAAVRQENAVEPSPDGAGAEPSRSREQGTISPDPAVQGVGNSDQYHGEDSRYQFTGALADAPWEWSWYLSLDCSGIGTSSSAQTGDPASLVWLWSWTWSWGCDSQQPPEAVPTTTAVDGEGQRAPPGPADGMASASEQEVVSSGPWTWTWDFDFCGNEVPVSAPSGAGTALIWTWTWTWTWTCGAAGGPKQAREAADPPVSGAGSQAGDGANQPMGEPKPPALDATSLVETLAGPASSEASTATIVEAFGVWLAGMGATSLSGGTGGLGGIAPVLSTDPIELAISLVVSPGTTENVPETKGPGTNLAGIEGIRAPRWRPLRAFPPAGVDIAADTEGTLRERWPRAEQRDRPRHPPTASARPLGSKTSLERLRSRTDLVSRRASGASPSAGGGASGLLVGVVAALIAFFFLAAPGIGRRIRPARLPSPHGRDDLRIDHPG